MGLFCVRLNNRMAIYNSLDNTKPLRPDQVERRLATSPLVTTDELRIALGLYEDDSTDDILDVALEAATDRVSQILGQPVGSEALICHYPRFAPAMEIPGELSYDSDETLLTTAAIGHYDGELQFSPASPDEAFIDPTSKTILVRDSLINSSQNDISSCPYINPVRVTLSDADGSGNAGRAVQAQAVLLLATAWVRNENMDEAARAASRILGTGFIVT